MRDDTDRAAGAILGAAVGDALGSSGPWSEHTATSIPILQAAASGESLTHEATQDEIVRAWLDWSEEAEQLGAQTAAVFRTMREASAHAARTAARALHDWTGRTAGAGSLARIAPVALPFVTDSTDVGLVRAATRISALTHADQDAADACVLWSAAIRHAIRTGELDVCVGLPLLPADRGDLWVDRIVAAEAGRPRDLAASGWVVHVFQAAWSAIATTPVPHDVPAEHLRLAIAAAARGGGVVATVAGALLGARWGASAVPADRRRILHGAPGLDANDLGRLAVLAANGGLGDGTGWPAIDRVRAAGPRVLRPHPHDAGVLLGSLAGLDGLPPDIDVVVSLCRTGRRQTDREQIEFRLIDQDGRNPNLEFVLRDAADTLAALRADGKRVFVHCAEGRSRTPTVGALYAALHLDVPIARAVDEVVAALPDAAPQAFLLEAAQRIAGARHVVAAEAAAPEVPPSAAPVPVRRPVLFVDLDSAMLDVESGVARLPAAARADHDADPAQAPGVIGLAEPIAGATHALHALAAEYDTYLLAPPLWADAAAAQQRLDWVQRHFGRGPTVGGDPNPAWQRLVFAHPGTLDPGATLVGGDHAADGFAGRVVRLGSAETPTWAAVLRVLLSTPVAGAPGLPEPASPSSRPLLRDLSRRQARGAARPSVLRLVEDGSQDRA